MSDDFIDIKRNKYSRIGMHKKKAKEKNYKRHKSFQKFFFPTS